MAIWGKKDTSYLYEQDFGKLVQDLNKEKNLAKDAKEEAIFLEARSQNFTEACEEILKITKGALSRAVFNDIKQKLEHLSAQEQGLANFAEKNLNKADAASGYGQFVKALKIQIRDKLNRGAPVTPDTIESSIGVAKTKYIDIFQTNKNFITSLEQEATKDLAECNKTHNTMKDARTLIIRADYESEQAESMVNELIENLDKVVVSIRGIKTRMDSLKAAAINDVLTWANKVKNGWAEKRAIKIKIFKKRQEIGQKKAALKRGTVTPAAANELERLNRELARLEEEDAALDKQLAALGITIPKES